MEALLRSAFGLGNEVLDRAWTRITEGFFMAFLLILVGTPVFAHWGWSVVILVTMLVFFMSWIVVTLRLRNAALLIGATFLYGIPAAGNADGYTRKALGIYGKLTVLVLIWAEVYMATYFHLPSLAKEWSSVGSAVAIMLVLIPLIIYAIASGKMVEGPWHRPVIWICMVFIALIFLSALPSTLWTSVGINPTAFSTPETVKTAQSIREQSFKNFDREKLSQMSQLQKKVDDGKSLTPKELEQLISLEKEVRSSVPAIPESKLESMVKHSGGGMMGYFAGLSVGMLLLHVFGAALIGVGGYRLVKKSDADSKSSTSTSSFPWFWIFLLIAAYYAYHTDTVQAWLAPSGPQMQSPASTSSGEPAQVPRRNFILESDWGHIGARKIAGDSVHQNMEPVFRIEKGTHSGLRPWPVLGMNGGNAITLIIEPDKDNEWKDLIIRQQLQCNEEFSDGSWGCSSSWFSRGDDMAQGVAYFIMKDGKRIIELRDANAELLVISFEVIRM